MRVYNTWIFPAAFFLLAACAKEDYTAEHHVVRGSYYREQRKIDKALEEYSEAIRKDPTLLEAYLRRASLHLGAGVALRDNARLRSAIEDYDAAIRLKAYNPTAYYFRGECRRVLGEAPEAAADFARSCEMKSPAGCAAAKKLSPSPAK